LLTGLTALVLAVGACGPAGSSSPGLTKLVVGLGYIPSVQFAQFYYADQAGYYRAAGLDVEFQNMVDPDLITLIGQGAIDIGLADGTSVVPAVSQGIPVRYAMTVYADFPSIVFAKASSGIRTAADLRGRRLGIPCKCGSSWIQLEALLAPVGLTPADLKIVEYPAYGQLTALQAGAVDAATGFANNEPLRLAEAGETPVVLALGAQQPLPGNGLIVGQGTLDGPKHDALRAFVAATIRAMTEIEADPAKGLDASIVRVPVLGSDRAMQAKILAATIDLWENDYTRANGTGAIDPAAWTSSIDFMRGLPDSPVAKPVAAADCVTDALLPSR
jgi:NitT/TauT family transport system substrate-binding protein